MSQWIWRLFSLILLVIITEPAYADKRIALVVGDSDYQNAAKLPNPARDASAIADMFKSAGFDVVSLQQNVGNLDFKRAVRRFEEAALDADIAVVFYAGHGIEIGGINYLVPTDARLASDFDAPDEAIPLDRIIDAVSSAKQLRLIILDACRDNPFVANMKRRVASRSVSAGLAKVEPTTADTLVAYAAKAGSTASDGMGEHSPYTTALLHNLMTPGLDIRLAFGRVRDEVMTQTGQAQEPYLYGSLGGKTVSLVGTSDSASSAAAGAVDVNAGARLDYQHFEKVGTKEAWNGFLILHPTGPYADLARAQIAKLAAAGDDSGPQRKADPKTSQLVAKLTAKPESDAAVSTPPAGPSDRDVARMLQTELKRVGCYQDAVDGDWKSSSRQALDLFNQNATTKLDSSKASLEAVGAVRDTQDRVCPLTCSSGFRAEGDRCVAITCDPGFAVGQKGACEPVKDKPRSVERSPVTPKSRDLAPAPSRQVNTRPPAQKDQAPEPKHDVKTSPRAAPAPVARAAPAPAVRAAPSQPAQVACDRFGCQPVRKGCRMQTEDFRGETQQEAVCN
jgi:uncharacterized caspase-like protein